MVEPTINTLYVKNLDTKPSKQEIRRTLYYFFSVYGNVLDVVVMKTAHLRGQAWIVFDQESSTVSALADASGKSINSKPMVVTMAKSVSNATKRAEGIYITTENVEHPSQAADQASTKRMRDSAATENDDMMDTDDPSSKRPRWD